MHAARMILVLTQWHVSTGVVKILAVYLALVVETHCVDLRITGRYAHVLLNSEAMHKVYVTEKKSNNPKHALATQFVNLVKFASLALVLRDVAMMTSALMIRLALIRLAKIHAASQRPVAQIPSVRQILTDRFVRARQVLSAIQVLSVVRYVTSVSVKMMAIAEID